MSTDTRIRRRPDGSIDTAHYMAQGRRRRSETAHHVAARAVAPVRPPMFGLAVLIALLPFLGGGRG